MRREIRNGVAAVTEPRTFLMHSPLLGWLWNRGLPSATVRFSFRSLHPSPFATRWGCKPEFKPCMKTLLPPQEWMSLILACLATSFCCYYLDPANSKDTLILNNLALLKDAGVWRKPVSYLSWNSNTPVMQLAINNLNSLEIHVKF